MKIESGPVTIVKNGTDYVALYAKDGGTQGLGSFGSLKEAVKTPLDDVLTIPLVRDALLAIWKKGEELNWNEAEIEKAFTTV